MTEQHCVQEREAKKLISYGIKMTKEEGGTEPTKFYPLYFREVIGYGISYNIGGLTNHNARKLIDVLAEWLVDDYVYLASQRVVKYEPQRGVEKRNKKAIAIKNMDYRSNRRIDIYLVPDKLPEPRKISIKEVMEKSIKMKQKYTGPLTPALPWESETFYKKEAEYTLADMLGCENYTLDVQCYGPNYFDLINVPLTMGRIASKNEIEKRELRYAKTMRALLLEKFEKIDWNNIAGLDEIKDEIQFKIQGPLYREDLFKKIPIPNTLLIGPPGTGKTMICKALVASLKNCNIVPFKPEFIAPFLGTTETTVADLFELCHNMTRETGQHTVLFWDDFDTLGSRFAGDKDKTITALLRLMGGGEKYDFSIIGTTNRPMDLDPAFYRPGRIDCVLYVGLPSLEEREKIIEMYTKELNLDDVDLKSIAQRTDKFTGADIKGLCIETDRNAIYRSLKKNKDNISTVNLEDIKVTAEDFDSVLGKTAKRICEINERWESTFSAWRKEHDLEWRAMFG